MSVVRFLSLSLSLSFFFHFKVSTKATVEPFSFPNAFRKMRCCLFAQDGRCLKDMYIGSYTSHPPRHSFFLSQRKTKERKNTHTHARSQSTGFFSVVFFSCRLCLTRTRKPFRTIVLPLCRLLKLVHDRHFPIFDLILLLVQWDN